MKINFNKPYPLLAGLLIILAINGAVFFKVNHNRSGTPVATLQLTERELNLPYWDHFKGENSAVHMDLNWRTLNLSDKTPSWQGGPDWINPEILARLGFDLSHPMDSPEGRRYYRKRLPKEVIWVFEFNGETYQKALEQVRKELAEAERQADEEPENETKQRILRNARADYQAELRNRSRLFVIDLGTDLSTLREEYTDPGRYFFLRGRVGIRLRSLPSSETVLYGQLQDLTISSVNVPARWHAVLEDLPQQKQQTRRGGQAPRYQATLALGQSLEPWLTEIKPLETTHEQAFSE